MAGLIAGVDSFAGLPLLEPLRVALDTEGYVVPTAIQAQSLQAILAGRDVLARAPTGSGKTVAFGLGLLQRLDASVARTRALVLCPTRELADQVAKALRRLAMAIPNVKVSLLTGGTPLGPQLASLVHPPHIVVGTPGRVDDLFRKRALDPAGIAVLVLDEADRMLDMGFEETVREILDRLPRRRQTLLFSATWPDAIREIGRSALRDPVEVVVAGGASQPEIEQWFHEAGLADKPAVLAGLLVRHRPESTVVFCNTRRDVGFVAETLGGMGFACAALHGDLDQRERDEVLLRFANRSVTVLVASDVAARGLDVKELACVVNYELPPDPDTYLHRVGRTARAGQRGLALSLVTPREMPRATRIQNQLGVELCWAVVEPRSVQPGEVPRAAMRTLRIEGGRADKLRPGDILGALTGTVGLAAEAVGRIDVFPRRAYVAVRREQADRALAGLRTSGIKGRNFRVYRM